MSAAFLVSQGSLGQQGEAYVSPYIHLPAPHNPPPPPDIGSRLKQICLCPFLSCSLCLRFYSGSFLFLGCIRANGDSNCDGCSDHLSSSCAVDQYGLLTSCIKDKKDASISCGAPAYLSACTCLSPSLPLGGFARAYRKRFSVPGKRSFESRTRSTRLPG